jgi:hypothetical protein
LTPDHEAIGEGATDIDGYAFHVISLKSFLSFGFARWLDTALPWRVDARKKLAVFCYLAPNGRMSRRTE